MNKVTHKINDGIRNSLHDTRELITSLRYDHPGSNSGDDWNRHRGRQRPLLTRCGNRADCDVRINKIRVHGEQGTRNLIRSTGTYTRTDIFAWMTFSFSNLGTTSSLGDDKSHASWWFVYSDYQIYLTSTRQYVSLCTQRSAIMNVIHTTAPVTTADYCARCWPRKWLAHARSLLVYNWDFLRFKLH